MSNPLSDYAIIGDTRSNALIGRDGTIEWLCWPRHDSPAIFTRLLDPVQGGCASIHIDNAAAVERRYDGDTAVLETLFTGPGGTATLTDLMPIAPPAIHADTGPDGDAQSRLVRLVACTSGRITGSLRVRLTPDYGAGDAVLIRQGEGWRIDCGDTCVEATASHPLVVEGGVLRLGFDLAASECAFIALTLVQGDDIPPIKTLDDAVGALAHTRDYWRHWCEGIRYDGSYRAAVVRSALTLKLLTYAPTGSIIAAATTSLPEAVPGNRNFDYRYSWIRDAVTVKLASRIQL